MNTVPRLAPFEKVAILKDHDRVVLGRKGRGRKTSHVFPSYKSEHVRIFGKTDIFKNLAKD